VSPNGRASRSSAVSLPPVRDVAGGVATLLTRAAPVAGEAVRLAGELVRVAAGTSELAPSSRDKRFTDETWLANPGYRRLMQAYLALDEALSRLLREVEESDEDWRTVERARLARTVLSSTVAPTNTLPGNPAAFKRAFETGGASLVRGVRNLVADIRHNGGMPAQVDTGPFVRAPRSRRVRSCSATSSRS
jgi:polyhydroxyalkanoate synthase